MWPKSDVVNTATTPKRSRLLLVEDDTYLARYIRKHLEREGFDVLVAYNGKEALEIITEAPPPDLIVSDLSLPDTNGLQLVEKLIQRTNPEIIPVIILSGASSPDQRVACLRAGAIDSLCKPIDGIELGVRIRAHLNRAEELRCLRHEARTDVLTGLPNRRGTAEALQLESNRARRSQAPLSLVIITVDQFQEIRDTYGHDVSTRIFTAVALSVKQQIRSTDVMGRIDDTQFVVALSGVAVCRANKIMQRLKSRISLQRMPHDHSHRCTISISMAVEIKDEYCFHSFLEKHSKPVPSIQCPRQSTPTAIPTLVRAVAALESRPSGVTTATPRRP